MAPRGFRPGPGGPVVTSFFHGVKLTSGLNSNIHGVFGCTGCCRNKRPRFFRRSVFHADIRFRDRAVGMTSTAVGTAVDSTSTAVGTAVDRRSLRVLELVRTGPSVACARLSRRLGLRHTAITEHVGDLTRGEIVSEVNTEGANT